MSLFNIKADLRRSHGSYLYDLNTKRDVLDLFGMYSSLPLGYNHPAFNTEAFVQESNDHLGVKVTNCEFETPAAERFIEAFAGHSSMRSFSHFHFCCTGALAIEATVKTALFRKPRGRIAVCEGSFHGINGYGGFMAAGEPGPASQRLANFPRGDFHYITKDPITEQDGIEVLQDLADAELDDLAAVLVEPIQCTKGDVVIDTAFLRSLREFCTDRNIPLIFDEIQTGFGGTGTMWRFEQLGVVPDMVVFGKKTQVSGIMVREPFAQIFAHREKLDVTWNGDVLDMIRCRAILDAYEEHKILDNVRWRGEQLHKGLSHAGLDVRRVGLLLAIDFQDKAARDRFVTSMWEDQATIMIPTGERCVRLRPNLAITAQEANDAVQRVSRVMKAVCV